MKTIYLIGFMGAGKTSAGKELSRRLNIPFYDTDDEIIKETGKTISDLFSEFGEEEFRSLETRVLKKIAVEDAVVATGGGMVLREENREWMKSNGIVIFLEAAPQEILNRLSGDTSRPLLSGDKEKIISVLMEQRLGLYQETSHFQIRTDGKFLNEVVDEIVHSLK
ncbi:shikimate kinase [Neobacillus sp. PS3-34]|uniref:shikimate kinase n=1 Tax=Neobacillus sp. PS3-34 TaxID=3070678 RepID=UPI0027DEB045|nr:shikimate kinase [Neobacillus sp. PS3-34]WML47539.1 shikimate kinase [Neobacillus sp. PS3-34]